MRPELRARAQADADELGHTSGYGDGTVRRSIPRSCAPARSSSEVAQVRIRPSTMRATASASAFSMFKWSSQLQGRHHWNHGSEAEEPDGLRQGLKGCHGTLAPGGVPGLEAPRQ